MLEVYPDIVQNQKRLLNSGKRCSLTRVQPQGVSTSKMTYVGCGVKLYSVLTHFSHKTHEILAPLQCIVQRWALIHHRLLINILRIIIRRQYFVMK